MSPMQKQMNSVLYQTFTKQMKKLNQLVNQDKYSSKIKTYYNHDKGSNFNLKRNQPQKYL